MMASRPTLAPVMGMSRRDAVVAEIRRGIAQGVIQPGERLTETALANSLQVSRATVREALGQLAREGLIVAEPYRGLRVADLDVVAVWDLANTRVSLDLLAAQSIVSDSTGQRLDLVRDAWLDFERTVDDPDPAVRAVEHLAFHRAIWSASENSILVQLWPVIEAHMTIALAQDLALRPSAARARRMHAELVAAFESGDLTVIESAVIVHNLTSADEFIALRTPERKLA